MAKRIVLKPGLCIATAMALFAAMISSSPTTRLGSRSGHGEGECIRIVMPVNQPRALWPATVIVQHHRMKAVSSESEQKLGETIDHAERVFDVPKSSRTVHARRPTYSRPFRPHSPLRC